MNLFRTTAGLCLSACLLASPAAAQQRSDTPDIVVTAPEQAPPTTDEVSHQARQITQGGDFLHTPLARFNDWLCPGILGLKTEYAAQMIDRVRWTAEQLHIRLADDSNCTPNLVIAFVDDGQAELAALDKSHGYLFDWMTTVERKALLAEVAPVHVWTTTVTRTRDGMPVPPAKSLDNPPVAMMWMAHSKIYLPIRSDISQVVVLFDKGAVKGKTLAQLADYATMRGLARTKSAQDGQALDSILTLFNPQASPPLSMTAFDRAYLASIYDGIPNINGASKIYGVSRQLHLQDAAEQKRE